MLRSIKRTFGIPKYLFSSEKPPQRPDKEAVQKMQKEILESMENNQELDQKPPKIKGSLLLGLGLSGVLLGYWITNYFRKAEEKEAHLIERTDAVHFGGNWKMFNLDGEVVTDKDLLGKNYIMYFGFTRCPDVCPAFLFKLTAALKMIERHQSSKMYTVIPVYVSLDPEYDTPERIRDFLKNYHPSTLGLYVPQNQISHLENCMKRFNVYSQKVPMGDTYSIDHSVIGYLMSEDGNFLSLLGPQLSSKQMAHKIEEELTYVQTIKLKKLASYY